MKKLNILLITIFTIASLLLALPLSPIRNSFSIILTEYTYQFINKLGIDLEPTFLKTRKTTSSISYKIKDLDIEKYNNYMCKNKFSNTAPPKN